MILQYTDVCFKFIAGNGLIVHGPDAAVGIDSDNFLVLACFSLYHCTLEVEYAWYKDGELLKQGRKSCILFVTEPGSYHCTVKVNDHEERSAVLNILEEVSNEFISVPRSVDMKKIEENGENHGNFAIIIEKAKIALLQLDPCMHGCYNYRDSIWPFLSSICAI